MFIDKILAIANKNKITYDMDKYRDEIKKEMIKNANKGIAECAAWLPCGLNLDMFNEHIKQDGIECVFLRSNQTNTKYKVHVSKAFDEEFWKKVDCRRKNYK